MEEKEKQQDIPLNMDGIVKILFRLSDKMTIRMINSLFGKKIPLDAKVITESGELHRFSQADPTVEEIRADMIVNINGERYHIEFETVNNKLMPVRVFEYGFMIAIRELKSYVTHIKNGIQLNYPKQYVIFVEQNDAIPERELTMKVILWDGDEKEYKVPIMRYWLETPESLEAKGLEPLLPLQVFKIRKGLIEIARSRKTEVEKEKLTEEKLREIISIYTEVTEKIRNWTENDEFLTEYHAEQMLLAVQHLSEYLYSGYKKYAEIESEAIKMTESKWIVSKWLREGELNSRKETAHEMFVDGKNILEIKKYSKLQDDDLADILRGLPTDIQRKYDLLPN